MGIDRYFEEQEKKLREIRKEHAPEWQLLKDFDALMDDLPTYGVAKTMIRLGVLWTKVKMELQK